MLYRSRLSVRGLVVSLVSNQQRNVRKVVKLIEPELFPPASSAAVKGSLCLGFTSAQRVLTSIPPVVGSRPTARCNSSVPSLLVGLGKGGKERTDSEILQSEP